MAPLKAILAFSLLILANAETEDIRNKKVFSLFSVVTFPNDICTGKTGDYGTCQSTTECNSNSGTADGNCASGFGVCCTFSSSTCGSTLTQNTSYISNPSYPTAYTTAGSCAFSITPLSSDICQIRLDFVAFDLAEDATTAACTDSFDVSVGSKRSYTTLCGTNTGHHIYIETGRATSAQTLTFTVASSATWKVLVTQLECSASWKAPSDCLQWYTGLSGDFKSFNYPTLLLQSLQYKICVRKEAGYCGVGYAPVQGSTIDTFIPDAITTALNGAAAYAVDAWIIIENSIASTYSGTVLAAGASHIDTSDAVIYQNGGTFGVEVVTKAASQTGNLGFHLTYVQSPCTLASVSSETA